MMATCNRKLTRRWDCGMRPTPNRKPSRKRDVALWCGNILFSKDGHFCGTVKYAYPIHTVIFDVISFIPFPSNCMLGTRTCVENRGLLFRARYDCAVTSFPTGMCVSAARITMRPRFMVKV